MQQQEKASGFAIQLSSNLLSSKAASLCGRPVFPCLLCVPTTWCANDGTVDSTTSTPVIESTATSRFSGILPLKHVRPRLRLRPSAWNEERGKGKTAIPEEKDDEPSLLPMTPESKQLAAVIATAVATAMAGRSASPDSSSSMVRYSAAPWIAGPTNHGVARCMDSILERMRGKQSKCLAIRPPGGHIFQCVPLTGLGARMAACWRPGELPSGGAAVEVLSTTIVFQTGTASLQTAAGVLL